MPFIRKSRLAHLEAAEKELADLLNMTPLEVQCHLAMKKTERNFQERLEKDLWWTPETPGKLVSLRSYLNNG